VTFDSGLLFAYDSDDITGAARNNLTSLAASLKKYPKTDVLIVGHTDATGTDSYNQGLSQRRSDAAKSFLISQGVASTRVRTSGRGEAEPIDSNETADGRSLNRRVEVAIFAGEEMRKSSGN
jgi:outer membrane protein OmpA-like peptidoglycan-associated protein